MLKLWPTLDDTLDKEVKDNLATGGIAMIIGLDHLYGRVSNTRYIFHPDKRLPLVHTNFEYSIGGSIASRHDSSNDQEAIQILTSAFKIEKEPTKQQDAEREIQENMANLFETEADKGPVDAENGP